jgi:hypothetical protein
MLGTSGDFWNIPYSQSLNPATTSNPDGYFLPVYDDAATIYSDLHTFKCCNSN